MNDWRTREGHALDLALERFVIRDLGETVRRELKEHLRACATCRARAEQVRLDLSVPLPPLDLTVTRAPSLPPPARPGVPWRWIVLGLAAGALVAAVLGAVGG